MSLLVGKFVEVVPREEGNEEVFHWYSPARVLASGHRSKYVKGSWLPDVRCNKPLFFSQGHGICRCRVLHFREVGQQ